MDLPTYNLEALEVEMSLNSFHQYPSDYVPPILFTWCTLNNLPREVAIPYSTLSLN